jgi:hypothetical protein
MDRAKPIHYQQAGWKMQHRTGYFRHAAGVFAAVALFCMLYALLKNAEAESYATLAWSR